MTFFKWNVKFFAFIMRILGSTSHNINFWNDGKTFSQFSVVLDQYSRDKKKKKTSKTQAIIHNRAILETKASWGRTEQSSEIWLNSCCVFWWDSFFAMETWSHSHVRETAISIQRKYEPVGAKIGRVSFYSNNPTARGGDKLGDMLDHFWSVMWKFLW